MFDRDPRQAEMGKDILPFEMGYLPDSFQKLAETELHETPDRRVQYARQLRDMLKRDERTKDIDFDEDFLLQNLRARKFQVDRALKNVRDLVNLCRKNPSMFSDFSFDVSVRGMVDKVVNVLPWRCHEGCTIIVLQFGNWKPSIFPVEELKRLFVIYLLQSLRDPMTQVNGFKIILNVQCSLKILKFCTPRNMTLFYHGTQECAPARYRAFHVVNDSLPFKTAWLIIKTFFSEKMKQRFHFHSTPDTLLEYFSPSVLPTSFGGDLKDYDQSNWLKRVMEPEKLAAMAGGILRKQYK